MKLCPLWIPVLMIIIISSGCAGILSYEEIAERHRTYTSGEKNATLDEWHELIHALEKFLHTDENSDSADEIQFAIASSWVWCIKAGDTQAPQHAIAAFRRLIYTYPDSEFRPQSHYWLARCYTHIGDSARAAHHYQTVTEKYPDTDSSAMAQLELARTYKQHGYEKRAETVYLDIVKSESNKDIISAATEELKQIQEKQKPKAENKNTPPQKPVKTPQKNETKPTKPEPQSLTPGSLTREFGLTAKTIVIDPGHGGKDPGGIGVGNLYEKPIALAISKKIAAILTDRGYTVHLTRDSDKFIPLKERTAFAVRHKADLFLSIHANASYNASANGIETYYLNITSSDKEAERIAARENANSGYTIQELESLLKGLIVESKSKDSRRLAAHIQRELVAETGAKDRGVKHARFVVLIGTSVPAVLIETGFITNPTEATKLTTDTYQEKVASAIVRGVEQFIVNTEQISQSNPKISNPHNPQLAATQR
ncbi:tetratricopeptide repeat protein [Candidatus Poribacteria bacterium]|nr:tetratricopeptide repeat protein [Candidatus Poribacteria bacterium]MYI93726.1 tetratricopeptide repeat protein [Candidatus Poribacteria bacterium]